MSTEKRVLSRSCQKPIKPCLWWSRSPVYSISVIAAWEAFRQGLDSWKGISVLVKRLGTIPFVPLQSHLNSDVLVNQISLFVEPVLTFE